MNHMGKFTAQLLVVLYVENKHSRCELDISAQTTLGPLILTKVLLQSMAHI